MAAYVYDNEKFPYPFSLRHFWVIQHFSFYNVFFRSRMWLYTHKCRSTKAKNFRLMDTLMKIDLNIHGQADKKLIWAIETIRYSSQLWGYNYENPIPLWTGHKNIFSHISDRYSHWWTLDSTDFQSFDTNERKIVCFNMTEGSCIENEEFMVCFKKGRISGFRISQTSQ